jgi:two-component system sensor histidine kinase MprB
VKLRTRLALVTALLVAVAVVGVATASWFATRNRLVHEIDRSINGRAQNAATLYSQLPFVRGARIPNPLDGGGRGALGPGDTFIEVIDQNGNVVARDQSGVSIPVDDTDRAIAQNGSAGQSRSTTSNGRHLRIRTEPIAPGGAVVPNGGAVLVARDLVETDRTLHGLGWVLGIISAVGVILAALVGLLVARRSLRPIDHLKDAAERVATTQDLETPVEGADRDDEVGSLATSFNSMLRALQESRTQQQQLVSDASHELRTPLTSLRTAIELLQRAETMPPEQQRELIDHAVSELGELTHLVTELVELATDTRSDDSESVDVRLDDVARSVAERAERRTGRVVLVSADPWVARGNPTLLERAVNNLVDNADKWSPPGAPIEVSVHSGEVRVRDHGPGVPADERERVFQRFARGRDAQAVPGSGLGLAIVRQIAAEHGGEAWLEAAPGGGTIAVLRIPGSAADYSEVATVS